MSEDSQKILMQYVQLHKLTGLADPRLAAAIEELLVEHAVYRAIVLAKDETAEDRDA